MERLDLLKELFDKKMIEIVKIFLENPKKDFTLTDISEKSGIGFATTHRKLNDLAFANIIIANKKSEAKKVHSYKLSEGDKILEISNIFGLKTNNKFSNFFKRSLNY